jgi:succinoglycan biosynthesis protein ExoM
MPDGADSGVAVSVMVPCFDRIELLERTLRACFTQSLPDGLAWEILVCDNHPDQLARSMILSLQPASPVPLRYLPAPARNIARARNVGVAAATGRYMAFVDDEAPDPGWLANYYACLERTGADAAFGPKYPVFASGRPPAWDPEARNYTTDFQVPADTQIGRVGRSGRVLGAGNSFMRMATCLAEPKPFNEQIGAADGEDTELYFRLLKAGRRFVSQTSARCRLSVSDNKLATHAMLLGAGLAQLVVHGALYVLTGEFRTQNRVRHRLGIARGLGKLTYRRGFLGFIEERSLPVSRLG